MMRKLTIFLSLFLVLGLTGPHVWGKPAGLAALNQQVERQVTQAQAKAATKTKAARPAAQQNPDGLTERQQQITAALDKVRLKADEPNLQDRVQTLSEFEAENQSLTRQFQYRAELLQELLQKVNKIILDVVAQEKERGNNSVEEVVAKVYTVEQKQPDYGKETKGIPFVYVTDASGHTTQGIVREVNAVMQAVRQANPKARILLATEFANMAAFATPIQFAGKTNKYMRIGAPYDKLVPQANQLGIDILALDDVIVWPWTEEFTGAKIGNRLLAIPSPYEKVSAPEQWQQIHGFVNMSTLGRKLRNEQWVSYIRAVQPFYDIVIVYAGNGHIDSPDLPELDVPIQLAQKHVIFNFYTVEQNEKEQEFFNNTYKMLCNANACVKVPEEEPQETKTVAQMYGAPWAKQPDEQAEETAEEWDGKSYIYQKADYQVFKKLEPLLPAEAQKKYKEVFNKLLEAGFEDVDPVNQFEVYLPNAE